ncbi:MAG TPA: SusC/RagA family TonB-linked outer membrane protein [Gemmatimonadaceae bacterium]|nr:SusC/RagA family TonB-linked outer membrane protein [Gemmatimonadaceae bacterium]
MPRSRFSMIRACAFELCLRRIILPVGAPARFGSTVAGALLVLGAALGATPGSAQTTGEPTGRITGVVTDSADNRPLPSVRISVSGTRLAAVTDDAGRFTVNNVRSGRYNLSARRLGYRQSAVTGVTVGDGLTATANFKLDPVGLTLEAVVTTGVVDPISGTRAPFTIGRVDAENAPVPATNAIETIQGKIAGVTVVPSGQPGSGTSILLRSPTSISKSISPLIVVDGVVIAQGFTGSTADLESMDIESVEVVKGAAASSLFGSRAASGVIQIKTRRGSGLPEGTTRVTARSEIGTNQLGGKIHWAQNHFYLTNEQGQYVNAAGAVVTRSLRVPKPLFARFQDVSYAEPVYDQVNRFFDPGQFAKNSINIAQNGARTNWLLSLVNTREDGVVLNSGKYEQNNIRLNLDHRPIETLELSFSGYHSRSDRNELYGDTFFDLINQAPDVDLLVPDPDGTPYIYQGDAIEAREENPLYVLSTEYDRRKRARTQGSLAGRYSPLSWLNFDGNLSYDRSDRRNDFFLDQGVKTEGFATGGPGEIEQFTGTTNAFNAAASANLLGRVAQLTMRSTLRALIERQSNQTTTASGTIFSAPGVRSLNNAQQRSIASLLEEVRATGYALTAGADYDGRYIVDGLVRRDGSSLFGPEERWNNYYRLSGAYRMSEESWWPLKSIDEFKLRASRGTAGTRPDFSDQYETFSFSEGGGLSKLTLGNKFLKPEHATETEVGIDAIFRQRYSLQLSYARNRVIDQLIQIPLAGLFGYTTQWQNAGTVVGNTLEGTLEAQLVRRPNFAWRMGIVADRSRNRITEFDRSCFTIQNIAFRCAGETLGAMYGFRFIRGTDELLANAQARASDFQVNDEGILVWVGAGNTFQEGETKKLWGTSATIGTTNFAWGMPIVLRDSTGSNRLVKIGDGNPDFHWGFSNNLSWNDFSVFTLLDAQVGGQVYNETNQRMYQWARSKDVDQAGKEQGLKKPVEYYVNLYAANDPTDYFVEDAGFVKLREVSLRYRLGSGLVSSLGRVGVSGISLSLIGRNLKTWTNYKGYDPEVGGTIVRRDNFGYPRYRTFTGSVEVTF